MIWRVIQPNFLATFSLSSCLLLTPCWFSLLTQLLGKQLCQFQLWVGVFWGVGLPATPWCQCLRPVLWLSVSQAKQNRKTEQLFRAGGDFLFPEKLEGINDDWPTCCNRHAIAKYIHAFSVPISCPNKGSAVKCDGVYRFWRQLQCGWVTAQWRGEWALFEPSDLRLGALRGCLNAES